jgi:hypothetical protein
MLTAMILASAITPLALDRVWDQTEARRRVQRVLEIEKSGRPWDRTRWRKSATEAEAESRATGKPLFLYFYLRKNVGPAAAPC